VNKPEQNVNNFAQMMKTVLLTSMIQKVMVGVSVGLNKKVMDTWEE
jgi:hypothetical protein